MKVSCLMLDGFIEDCMSFKGDDDCFMCDVSGVVSRMPAHPMKVDVELVLCNEGGEEM